MRLIEVPQNLKMIGAQTEGVEKFFEKHVLY